MCWTAEDCALMMNVLVRHNPLDPASASFPVPDFTASPRSLSAFNAAMDVFSSLGATVTDITLPPQGVITDLVSLITAAEAFAIHGKWLRETPDLYGERGRLRIMAGAFVSGETLVNAHRERARLSAIIAAAPTDADLLMMPTRHIVSPILGDYDSAVVLSLTRPFNLTGYPALSICDSFTRAGLPASPQIGGRPFEEHLVLKAGDAFEKATGFRKIRPALAAV
jgi:aspartyl-tRNA(Asn)/glutamyl-tRNA(Gln) amidotransferase subunit A